MSAWYYVKEFQVKDVGGQWKPAAATVVFHINVPGAAQNSAGISYQTIAAKLNDPDNSEVPDIQADHLDQYNKLVSGEAIEVTDAVRFSSVNLTDAQRQAEIVAKAAAIQADLFSRRQAELEWFGFASTTV